MSNELEKIEMTLGDESVPSLTLEPFAEEKKPEVPAEVTAEPEATIEPTATPEPTEVPEVIETVLPDRSVDIYCDNDVIRIGDTVTLKSEISGFEGVSISYEWQCLMIVNDQEEWVTCGSGSTYSFTMTEELMDCDWRLLVITNE